MDYGQWTIEVIKKFIVPCLLSFVLCPTSFLIAQKDSTIKAQVVTKKFTKETKPTEVVLIIDGASFGTINLSDFQAEQKKKKATINGIPVDDIAHLTILNGSDGLKKYGEKAKDGVLEIITKSGKYSNENWRIRDGN